MKKTLAFLSLFFFMQGAFAQDASPSFFTKSYQSDYLENLDELNGLNHQWKLDFSKYAEMDESSYLSGFEVISPIDSRFMNYPSQDLADHSRLLLGNYSLQQMKIGNLQMNTIYLFDVTGRMVDYQTNFSLWKSKK